MSAVRSSASGGAHTHHYAAQRRLVVFLPLSDQMPEAMRAAVTRAGGGLPSWRCLPFNPTVSSADPPRAAGGLPARRGGREALAMPEDFPFYCDPCQKGFRHQAAYDAHMAKHMYCAVPGCGFTCKADKAWKMEAHMDLLHNRPDAPALADPALYRAQRRQRFPTQETVHQKVEELYYKAARGVVMPDERRRWMRQHGIHIGKRLRTEHSYIARGTLPTTEEAKAEQSKEENDEGGIHGTSPSLSPSSPASSSSSSSSCASSVSPSGPEGRPDRETASAPSDPRGDAQATSPKAATVAPSAVPKSAAARYALYQAAGASSSSGETADIAKRVPRFYVCSRCGEKGDHWVRACPTAGDPRYDRHLNWGEPKRAAAHGGERNSHSQQGTDAAPPASLPAMTDHGENMEADTTLPGALASSTAELPTTPDRTSEGQQQQQQQQHHVEETTPDESLGAPPARSARRKEDAEVPPRNDAPSDTHNTPVEAVGESKRELTRVIAPVAAARLAAASGRGGPSGRGRGRCFGSRGRGRGMDGPPPPSLYEKLTEEDRLNEDGLLLQAIRFFVARKFFQ